MPDFANAIASMPGTDADDDARVLRAALATTPGPKRAPGSKRAHPRGAAAMREAAQRLRQRRAREGEAGERPAASPSLCDWSISY